MPTQRCPAAEVTPGLAGNRVHRPDEHGHAGWHLRSVAAYKDSPVLLQYFLY